VFSEENRTNANQQAVVAMQLIIIARFIQGTLNLPSTNKVARRLIEKKNESCILSCKITSIESIDSASEPSINYEISIL
jgi:hypothetical protein